MGDKKINVYFNTLDEVSLPILERLRDLRPFRVKLWFDRGLNDQISYIRDKAYIAHNTTDNTLICYNWHQHDETIRAEYQGLKHLLSRVINDDSNFVCIDSKKYPHNQLVLFQDAAHLKEYPEKFVKIPCFNDIDALLNYLKSQGTFSFSLENPNDFQKVTGISPVQGAPVYREIKTGRYWYMDMMHKTHYEIFDSTGKHHLGEADLNGVFDATKRDSDKRSIF